ncbi:protein-L-isoaspartate(D-aspartate) O-methyltransferase [Flammeovirgaceae bacterium SG7u.111]|nr:protein-L-isoaspartate(D-aspartate) O-methyltransferase [Flammeovirgaceae bacterium SG7u.132]WPO37589.1 protein-L-isoaspartate(D-aspartate) O-methyltransferase [Flammeovirgaceae bacterium SG7u.111]
MGILLEDNYKHKGLRNSLVNNLRKKGIYDEHILNAFMEVPRHFFLDSAFENHAYEDKAFGIGEGQTISQPYTVAVQTSLLDIKKSDKVLEIGTGSGFQACILAEMGCQLFTIEYNRKLYSKARKMLDRLGYSSHITCGDGSKGLPLYAPFDKILVTAGAPMVPKALVEQLAVGGVLVIPVGDRQIQKMLKITKVEEGKIKKEEYGDFSFVKLRGKQGWQ